MGAKGAGQRLAEAVARIEPDLLVPDFWLNEATNVLWLQVRRKLFTPDEAREGLALLRAQIEPTPAAGMALHELALDIGIAVNQSPHDTLHVAFAIAMGASAVVAADGPFVQSIRVATLIRVSRPWFCRSMHGRDREA
jgi:predicted nucleic acid-binding protein